MKRSTGVYPNALRNDTPKAWETQGLTSGKQCLGATQPDFRLLGPTPIPIDHPCAALRIGNYGVTPCCFKIF